MKISALFLIIGLCLFTGSAYPEDTVTLDALVEELSLIHISEPTRPY